MMKSVYKRTMKLRLVTLVKNEISRAIDSSTHLIMIQTRTYSYEIVHVTYFLGKRPLRCRSDNHTRIRQPRDNKYRFVDKDYSRTGQLLQLKTFRIDKRANIEQMKTPTLCATIWLINNRS